MKCTNCKKRKAVFTKVKRIQEYSGLVNKPASYRICLCLECLEYLTNFLFDILPEHQYNALVKRAGVQCNCKK